MKQLIQLLLVLFVTAQITSAQVTLLNEFRASNHNITAVAYGKQSNLTATAGYDESIVVRDAQGEVIKRIKGHKDLISSLVFSANDKFVVGGGYKGDVFVWNIETGVLVYQLKGHKRKINSIDVSANGVIASGSVDKRVLFWELESGKTIHSPNPLKGEVTSVHFSDDGTKLVSGSKDGSINMWDGKNGALLKTMQDTDKSSGSIQNLSISPDGRFIHAANSNGKITVWNTATGLKINEYGILTGEVFDMRHSPDGRYLAISIADKGFRVLNAETGAVVYQNEKFKDKVYSLAFSADGRFLINCDYSNRLYQWDISPLGIPSMLALIKQEKMDREKKSEPATATQVVDTRPKSDVDIDIPQRCTLPNRNRYALIIGNEDYKSHQMGLSNESNVDFAINDASSFRNYARNVFCVPDENIIFLTDARAVEMHRAIEKISLLVELAKGNAEVIFFFAGHGFPDEVTKEPYIMPVDVSGNDLRFAIKVSDLYKKFTEHPHQRVTVFLDACFTGGARNQGLLAARAVRVRPKEDVLQGNVVVFSASSGQESSLPYKDQQHGMFTYHLLKKLKETSGNISYGDLSDYIVTEVARRSILINNKPQNPQVNVSHQAMDSWKEWGF